MEKSNCDDPKCPRRRPISTDTSWNAADFSWSGIYQHSRKGSLSPGYLDAYGDQLRGIGLMSIHPSSNSPPTEG